jgi:small GTP-binding protein
MAKERQDSEITQTSEEVKIPPGLKLLHRVESGQGDLRSLAFDPRTPLLASGGDNGTIKLWDVRTGEVLHSLTGGNSTITSLMFDPAGEILASSSLDGNVRVWKSGDYTQRLSFNTGSPIWALAFDPQREVLVSGHEDHSVKEWALASGQPISTFDGHANRVRTVAFAPTGGMLSSGSDDETTKIWNTTTSKLQHTLNDDSLVLTVTFNPQGNILACAGITRVIKIYDPENGQLLRILEGHTSSVESVRFSPDGALLASKSTDGTIRLWSCETWSTIAVIPQPTNVKWRPALAFHPTLPLLAAAGNERGAPDKYNNLIQIWEFNYEVLLGSLPKVPHPIHHVTGKVVLVGDHSVGKSALGYRLIHDAFKEQASTHGQQFWVFPRLGKRRDDGTECEAILWDFAGQPDYRLVHALFVDNADLALVLFDASDIHDPLHGVGFWLKQLQRPQSRCPIILVAAQIDRGSSPLTEDELKAFSEKHGVVGPIPISAATGEGIDELVERMKSLIPWDKKPAIVTTATFKRIKDYVLGLKEAQSQRKTIVRADELRSSLQATDSTWSFSDDQMLTAVDHLENYGYVKRLRTSKGEIRILLEPERLNNLASSFVLEARRNPKGLGALEEKRLLTGGYNFSELKDLEQAERDVLLDSAALLFLEHNVCFRETDPLRMEPYLVFPELINLKAPPGDDRAIEEGVAYTVTGPTENVFASLVVLLGYTHTFTRTAQWQNNARYEVGEGLVCGFRQEAERDGELDFVLCFGTSVGLSIRTLFQGLFESFLARRNLTVVRYEPIYCTNHECGHLLDRSVMRQRMKERKTFAFCNECGERLMLPALAEPIQLTREVQVEVESQRRAAEQRTQFEQAIFRVHSYIVEQKIEAPQCFITYAWGEQDHERWVEKRLAADLQKAGIEVILDRWHNAQIGASVARFIERIEKSDRIVMVGTPEYRRKYENRDSETGYVVAAEVDLIANRLLGTEEQKASVLPLILSGDKTSALPPLLHGRVYADFRNELEYFKTAFDLILSLYQLLPNDPAVADLRDSLQQREIPI